MFKELPRFCGFPNQVYVTKKFAFNRFFDTFNGKCPFFVSTYQFKDRVTPIVDSLVFDIDSYLGYTEPYHQTKKLKIFCEKNSFPFLIDLSGRKGFHEFMIIEDIIPETELERELLKDKIYSVQVAICKQLGITAVDYATFGRLHMMIRYPTSKYVRRNEETGKNECNGCYCRNIPSTDFNRGLRHIGRMSKEPGTIPKKPKSNITLDDIIEKLPNYKLIHRTDRADTISLIRAGIEPPTLRAVGLPCLKELASHSHPPHHERIELCSWLKFLGYTDLAIEIFIKNRNWTRYDSAISRYQVSTLLPRYPRCKMLRESYGDLCKKCPLGWKKK